MSGIYLRGSSGELIAMTERPYETEDVLQALLADHPGLLAGDQVADAPRRWVLLSREVGVADSEGASGRWSVDHLFVDQDAIPTLVEVKRSADTRIRREVVGQLLEYAANGTRYWPVNELRALYEAGCRTRGVEPEQELSERLGTEIDVDAWWDDVGANLKLGRLRLVFVADKISRELRRIIEFLNAQMTETEVLGVEIRQYVDVDNTHQTLVPTLIGQTEAARETKATRGGRTKKRWDLESWFEVFSAEHPEDVETVERLTDWAQRQQLTISFGSGTTTTAMQIEGDFGGQRFVAFRIYTYGARTLELPMARMPPPFDERTMRVALAERLTAIPGIEIPEDRLEKFPTSPISALRDRAHLNQFTQTMDWMLQQARADSRAR